MERDNDYGFRDRYSADARANTVRGLNSAKPPHRACWPSKRNVGGARKVYREVYTPAS